MSKLSDYVLGSLAIVGLIAQVCLTGSDSYVDPKEAEAKRLKEQEEIRRRARHYAGGEWKAGFKAGQRSAARKILKGLPPPESMRPKTSQDRIQEAVEKAIGVHRR